MSGNAKLERVAELIGYPRIQLSDPLQIDVGLRILKRGENTSVEIVPEVRAKRARMLECFHIIDDIGGLRHPG